MVQGKCGMKLLQFFALQVPAVATPAGVNSQIVEHGTNGFWQQPTAIGSSG